MDTVVKAREILAQIVHSACTTSTDSPHTEETRWQLSELFLSEPIQVVRSRVLGEAVLWAADNAEIPADNDLVVYRESELRELVGCEPEVLRAIHKVKSDLDGEIVGNAPSYE